MAKLRKTDQQQSKSAVYLLLILIIVLPIVAGLFFKDYRQVPYGLFISILWLVASFLAFGFSIVYFGQLILPGTDWENWIEGVNMLLRTALNSAPKPVRSRKSAEYPGEENLPPSFETLRAGLLRSYQVLAIDKDAHFSRSDGPGFVRLKSGESVTQVLDLRRHSRNQKVTANTLDGIPLFMNLSIIFRIKRSSTAAAGNSEEYPYDNHTIFQLSQAGSVDEHNKLLPWTEQIAPQAASYLVSEMAQHTLDELSGDPGILNGINDRVQRELVENFDILGIEIMNVAVITHDLPDEIVQQRLAIWRAPWERKIQIQIAARNAEILRRYKQARAQAQVRIIENIMANISEMGSDEVEDLAQVVNLRVIEALDEAIATSRGHTHIPGQVLANLALETTDENNPPVPPDTVNEGEEDEN